MTINIVIISVIIIIVTIIIIPDLYSAKSLHDLLHSEEGGFTAPGRSDESEPLHQFGSHRCWQCI